MERLSINLPYSEQTVYVGNKIFDVLLNKITCNKYDKILFTIDKNVYDKYSEVFMPFKNLPNHCFYISKFDSKKTEQVLEIIKFINKNCFTRKSVIISFGGGTVGDIVGCVASMYLRGIDFIQVGTTFMSHIDAIIGKVAVNLNQEKNRIGFFNTPKYTICDFSFLNKDPFKIKQDYSEVIKHFCISYQNLNKFYKRIDYTEKYLTNIYNYNLWKEIVLESIDIKLKFVQKDPYDKLGSHKALSLGHTFANAIEEILPNFSHGEAVWLGILMSMKAGNLIQKNQSAELFNRIKKIWPYTYKHISINKRKLLSVFKKDKISMDGNISLVLLKKIGFTYIDKNIDSNVILSCFNPFFHISDE